MVGFAIGLSSEVAVVLAAAILEALGCGESRCSFKSSSLARVRSNSSCKFWFRSSSIVLSFSTVGCSVS